MGDSESISPPETSVALCAICQSPFEEGANAVACPACSAVYHAECWEENGGCAVYGCSLVPSTERIQNLNVAGAWWGQDHKVCPVCKAQILAAALRCKSCGTVFASARPEDSTAFSERARVKAILPSLRRKAVALFVLSVIPCSAPVAAVVGFFWCRANRETLRALPSLHQGLCKIGLIVSAGQTLLFLGTIALLSILR